jgi:hypothetical protein
VSEEKFHLASYFLKIKLPQSEQTWFMQQFGVQL